MSEWITDRLPTAEDALSDGSVWIFYNYNVMTWSYEGVQLGTPWQPITKPAPYVKPARYTVSWNSNLHVWNMYDNGKPIGVLPRGLPYEASRSAQFIADLYNEVQR